jgi:hypothetical protein
MFSDDVIRSCHGVIHWTTVLAIVKRVVATLAVRWKVEKDELEGRVQLAFVKAVRDKKFEFVDDKRTCVYIKMMAEHLARRMLREDLAHCRESHRLEISQIPCVTDTLDIDLNLTESHCSQEMIRSLLAKSYRDELDVIICEGVLKGKSTVQIAEKINQRRPKPVSAMFVSHRLIRLVKRVRTSLTIGEEKQPQDTVHSLLTEASQVADLVPEFIAGNLAADEVQMICETAKEDEELAARIAILGHFAGYADTTLDQSLPTLRHQSTTRTPISNLGSGEKGQTSRLNERSGEVTSLPFTHQLGDSHMFDNDSPHALAKKWTEEYSEFLFLTIALRDLVNRKINRGMIRGLITTQATSLLETTDQLATFGFRPTLGLAGAESDLWSQTVRYVSQIPWQQPPAGVPLDELAADLTRMQALWEDFEAFVGRLPGDFCESSQVLSSGPSFRTEGNIQLLGHRISPTAIVVRLADATTSR